MTSFFFDKTTFEHPEPGTWNGWQKESNGQLLIVRRESETHHYAAFENFSGSLMGSILSKTLSGLQPQTEYCISLKVRRIGLSTMTPSLSWDLDGSTIDSQQPVVEKYWHTLRWRFTASKNTHKLTLVARDSNPSGPGNDHSGADFFFDDIFILPCTVHENFDNLPKGFTPQDVSNPEFTSPIIITRGEKLELTSMTINFVDGPGQAGIQAHSSSHEDMLDGPALVLCRGNGSQPAQLIRLDLISEFKRVRFAWTWRHQAGKIVFYNSENTDIGKIDLEAPPQVSHQWLEFNAPKGQYISRIDVQSTDYSYLDFFTFNVF